MLSKFPIKWSEHHLLPSPEGEIACAIHATIDYYGTDVDIVIGHNGNEEHTLDRKLQVEELARIMKGSPNPLIYAGFFFFFLIFRLTKYFVSFCFFQKDM